jgi:hypothetical protein
MAATAPRRQPAPDERPPPLDPVAVPRAMVAHRARRYAREDHTVEVKRGRIRFWTLVITLLFVGAVLAFTIWDQIEALFGISP